jgi:hypothetical protein
MHQGGRQRVVLCRGEHPAANAVGRVQFLEERQIGPIGHKIKRYHVGRLSSIKRKIHLPVLMQKKTRDKCS